MQDSHAQLMVHWLGEGTNVMICLAREPPPGPMDDVKTIKDPSSVYISYDNGDTFHDKTNLFMINDTETGKLFNSSIDQFTTHPTYNSVGSRVVLFSFSLLLYYKLLIIYFIQNMSQRLSSLIQKTK